MLDGLQIDIKELNFDLTWDLPSQNPPRNTFKMAILFGSM